MLIFTQKPSMSRLLLPFLFMHFYSFAQLTEKEEKQVVKLVGGQTAIGKNQTTYLYNYCCEGCTPDPSITIENDTNGLIYENEFLLFRHPISFKQKEEVFKLIQENYVSVFEYQQFQDYVRDSMARERIYQYLESDEEAAKLLKTIKYYNNGEDDLEMVEFSVKDRELNRATCYFNWDNKISLTDENYVPMLYTLYLPLNQRYYKIKESDPRKFFYRYFTIYEKDNLKNYKYIVDEEVNTIAHTFFWANGSNSSHDRNATIGYLYFSHFKTQPIIGINGYQASAFCHWKAQEIQSKFDKNHLNYQVVVTLPSKEDLQSIQVKNKTLCLPEVNLSENCKITVKEYQEFVKAVQDSILIENLYLRITDDKESSKLIDYQPYFYSDSDNEYIEHEISDKGINRYYFNLKLNKRVIRKNKILVEAIKKDTNYIKQIFIWTEKDVNKMALNNFDLSLNKTNSLGHNTGVFSHKNFSDFFRTHTTSLIVSSPQNRDPNALMQGLTYEQAQAFYFFKNPIYKATEKSDWTNYIFPTEEQFKRIQAGETVILPQENLAFPSPVFRYVVHVFPK